MSKDKLTIKQEKFALAYFKTGNASEAYRLAYDCSNTKPESVNRNAFAQLQNVKIASRIRELKENLAKKHEITLDSITQDFTEARDLAKEMGKTDSMISATAHIARLHGIGTDDPAKKPLANISLNFNEDMMYNMLQRFALKKKLAIEGNKDGND